MNDYFKKEICLLDKVWGVETCCQLSMLNYDTESQNNIVPASWNPSTNCFYLPWQTLKTILLVQAHSLGQITSHVFFSSLSLHFGVHCYHKWHLRVIHKKVIDNPKLLDCHNKWSHEILMHTIKNNQFANRVQTLKIYAPSSGDSDIMSMWERGTE